MIIVRGRRFRAPTGGHNAYIRRPAAVAHCEMRLLRPLSIGIISNAHYVREAILHPRVKTYPRWLASRAQDENCEHNM